jgi:arginyl-tRNA synthetase
VRNVYYGLVSLRSGKVSARAGTFISADDILSEATKRAREAYPDTADESAVKIASTSVKYSLLKATPTKPVVFDWGDVLNLKRNSGPYIIYSYRRLLGILKKVRGAPCKPLRRRQPVESAPRDSACQASLQVPLSCARRRHIAQSVATGRLRIQACRAGK